MNTIQEKTFTVGKYLISPMTGDAGLDGFRAAVSIRSGSGRATHDRVFRFAPLFPTRESARRYAAREGRALVAARG